MLSIGCNNTPVKTRILVLGSTGSIGTQALEVIAANPDRFTVVGLAAGGGNPDLLAEQARAHGVSFDRVACADAGAAASIDAAVRSGADSAERLVRDVEADVVLNALVGSMGLGATLAALESGARLALANKESLVAGGSLVLRAAEAAGEGRLVPVDSEHSAMAQCLRSGTAEEVDRLVLTASGGPFRGWTRERLMTATPEQAGAHPTWSMGPMNTLNSASMVNKGLELIEASLLFDVPADRIDVTVHPQSIVHSMVTFTDGGTIAQASPPSMKLPIALAMGWPERVAGAQHALDFRDAMDWRFEPLDDDVFPAVRLAREAVTAGGCTPAVYNAANEEAAAAFLAGRIAFPHIVDVVGETMAAVDATAEPRDIADVLEVEGRARSASNELADRLAR
ncbi:1-deoxy-D-xylulose-5-phosphate reductoisomerase [uncultured Corynebacterium sp.]|uniref:1-deoxy-D-xylulose-5-phosphate reductoisomerase n=1 Tax=uncultured Corynebacterium sp. TaxID=159447 RepID=UPI0025CD577C|nr:1-deoxy-D-xylulose-5-phosphate reductoisomerase [uncultured Corynebacterium sp.]